MHRSSHRNRVLIVEDDEQVLKISTRILQRDFDVTSFSRPAAALEELLYAAHDYALVLTDIVMPELSGLELVRRARRAGISTAFVLMSGYAPEEIIRGHLPPGCLFLAKPFDPRELNRVLHAAISFTHSPSLEFESHGTVA